jgi:hypothetical protein
VLGAHGDVEDVALLQDALVALDAGRDAAIEYLEPLGLSRMEVPWRRGAAGPVKGFYLERVRRDRADRDRFGRGEIQRRSQNRVSCCGFRGMSEPYLEVPPNQHGRKADHVKTQKERSEERRREKLAAIQEPIAQGMLTVRKMTDKERAALPPRPGTPKRRSR